MLMYIYIMYIYILYVNVLIYIYYIVCTVRCTHIHSPLLRAYTPLSEEKSWFFNHKQHGIIMEKERFVHGMVPCVYLTIFLIFEEDAKDAIKQQVIRVMTLI